MNRLNNGRSPAKKRTATTLFLWLLTIIVLSITGGFIYKRIVEEIAVVGQIQIEFSPYRIAFSLVSISLSILLGSWIWNKILDTLGLSLFPLPVMRLHLISNLSKYVPGLIWPYVGKALLASRNNIPVNIVLMSIIWEFTFIGLGGLAWLIFSLPFCNFLHPLNRFILWFEILGLTFLGLLIYFLPKIMAGIIRIFNLWNFDFLGTIFVETDWRKVRFLLLYVFLGWGFLIAGFVLLIPSTISAPLDLARLIFAFVSSILIGLIFFLVPLGLGIREATLINLLSPDLNALSVFEVSILFRLEMIVGEVLSALLLMALAKRFKNRKEKILRGGENKRDFQ